MSRVTVLNADNIPLTSVTLKHSVRMLVRGVAELVEWIEDEIFGIWNMPKVVRLTKFIYPKWKYEKAPKFSKTGVMLRDNGTCAYCSGKANTIDHVMPSSLGGANSWTNCVAACFKCNNKKSNKTPEQAGMELRIKPRVPRHDELIRS